MVIHPFIINTNIENNSLNPNPLTLDLNANIENNLMVIFSCDEVPAGEAAQDPTGRKWEVPGPIIQQYHRVPLRDL